MQVMSPAGGVLVGFTKQLPTVSLRWHGSDGCPVGETDFEGGCFCDAKDGTL